MAESGQDDAPARRRRRTIPETVVERACLLISEAALAIMLGLTTLDIVTRAVFNHSFEVSDEVGGYMLVVITFFSLAVCHVNGSFHEVEFVQARLSERGRTVSRLIFELIALAACLLLTWYFIRFEMSSWRFDNRAPTYLGTPLWLPQLAMPLGMAALCFSLMRSLALDLRRLRLPDTTDGRRP
jgi:TRAP-type C4-dicarboxylate transport system permease small subunit